MEREREGWLWKQFRSQSVRMIMAAAAQRCIIPSRKRIPPLIHPSGVRTVSARSQELALAFHMAELQNSRLRNRCLFARRSLSRLVAPLSLLPAFLTHGIAVVGCNGAICIRSVVAETNSTLVALKEDAEYTRVKFGNFRPRKTRRKEAPIFDVRAEGKGVKK